MDDVSEVVRIDGGIVVGHDGSKCSQEALAWAAALAARAALDLHVVRAWAMMTAPKPSTWAPGFVPPLTDYEKAVHDELTSHVEAARLPASVRVTCHVVHKSPAQGLMSAAEGADLMVLGARGRGGFAELLLGSVTDQLVHHAPCPVTVIRAGAHGRGLGAVMDGAGNRPG